MQLMKTITHGRVIAPTVAALAVLALALATSATASAAPDPARSRAETIAVAIGALETPSGGHTWLSLQAGTAAGAARGGFRYYCPSAGYYNGVVRSLTVTDGAVHAEGAGRLIRPDGTRMRVQFTLDVTADGSAVAVHIAGDDYQYDMSGSLDGFVFAGAPADWSAE